MSSYGCIIFSHRSSRKIVLDIQAFWGLLFLKLLRSLRCGFCLLRLCGKGVVLLVTLSLIPEFVAEACFPVVLQKEKEQMEWAIIGMKSVLTYTISMIC